MQPALPFTVLGDHLDKPHSRTLGCIVVPKLFSVDECQQIMSLGESADLDAGFMQTPYEGYRRCQYRFISEDAGTNWVFHRLRDTVLRLNEHYQFRLSRFVEGLQFTRYTQGGVIHWHTDTGTGIASTRKISISIQLSTPTDYEGGDFELCPDGTPPFARNQGNAIIFPSFLAHRVTEITAGVRYALVVWAHGPAFS
jgi:PKHD-type hydroxylase